MFKNKVFLFGSAFLFLVIFAIAFITYRGEISSSINLFSTKKQKEVNIVQKEPITILNGSSAVTVKANMNFINKIYQEEVVSTSNQNDIDTFEPITIQFTDEKQDTSYAWEDDKHYESITIRKKATNGTEVFIQVVPDVMYANGWSTGDIEREIEQLIIQSIITRPSLYLTGDTLEEKRSEAFRIIEKYGFEKFVTLQ